jgi:hypothetical protein
MKETQPASTKQGLIIEVWEHLGGPPIGAAVLEQIQFALRDQFGDGSVASPAAIARVLADEGAELRHPEVLEYDARWREAELQKTAGSDPGELFDPGDKWNLKKAAAWIKRLERLRQKSTREHDLKAVTQLENRAREAKRHAQLLAASSVMGEKQRAAAAEIAEWLTIWLQTPQLFKTWLELRLASPEYLRQFANKR